MLGIKSKEIIKSENEITKSADPCRGIPAGIPARGSPAGARGIQDPPGKRQAIPPAPGRNPGINPESGIPNPGIESRNHSTLPESPAR